MPSHSRPISKRWAPFTLAVALMAVARVAHAAWPPTPTQNVPLCTTAFSSQIGTAIPDQRGGAIAVWYEDRAGDFDVFARRVDSGGFRQWTADGVRVCVAPAGTAQILPKAVSDGAGGVVVVWIDGRNGPNALFAQHVDSSGVRQWGDPGVILATGTTNQVTEFSVESDGAGGIVVAWASSVSGISSDIYAQRLNASGVLQWGSNAKTLCSNKLDQVHPVLVRKTSGTFVVAWEDQRAIFNTFVFGQAVTGAGTLLWAADGLQLVNSAENAINPMLVATGSDDCLLFWDADSVGVGDIRGKRLGTAGAAVWAGAGLHLFPIGVSGLLGGMTDHVGGAYLLTSATKATTHTNPLWAQRVQGDGSLLFSPSGERVSSVPSNQVQVALAPDNQGGLLLTWYDDVRGLAPDMDIIAQRLSPFGGSVWYASGVSGCLPPNQGPGLCIRQSGGAAVSAWSHTRHSPSPGIYAHRLASSGRPQRGARRGHAPPPAGPD